MLLFIWFINKVDVDHKKMSYSWSYLIIHVKYTYIENIVKSFFKYCWNHRNDCFFYGNDIQVYKAYSLCVLAIYQESSLLSILMWRSIIVIQYNRNISTFSVNVVIHKNQLFRVTTKLFILLDILDFRHKTPQFTIAKLQIQYIHTFNYLYSTTK